MNKPQPRAIGFIFARGGSKGVRGKNIKPVGGKPLIGYAIETARSCKRLETVIVSTDDAKIASVAHELGAEIPFMRPAELATDTSPEWQSWQHAIRWVQAERGAFDIFVSLPPTSPFRAVTNVDACIDLLIDDPDADIVITVRDAARSPFFSMVRLDDAGFAHVVIDTPGHITRRQDVPAVYDITTVAYVARPSFILDATHLFDGRVRTVRVPEERALDIDTPYDFMLAECIARLRRDARADRNQRKA